jgi:DNA-binding MarR family transcriptional regulator
MERERPTAVDPPVPARLPIAGRLAALAKLIHRSALRVYPLETGISFVDAAVVGGIGTQGPMTASALAQQLTMHEGHLSRTLKSLEKGGYLARLADPADSRRKLLMLTREGRALSRTVVAVQARRAEELLAGIPEADRTVFFRTLDAIQNNAETMLAGAAGMGTQSSP